MMKFMNVFEFLLLNEVSEANFNEYKIILNRQPFLKKVYSTYSNNHCSRRRRRRHHHHHSSQHKNTAAKDTHINTLLEVTMLIA